MSKLRPGALAATWLVASLTAGLASTLMGYVENLRGDGSIIGILDATGGWLLGTFAPACFFLAFFFLPIMVLLEWRHIRGPGPYVLGGALGGALAMAAFVWPVAYDDWVWLLVVPGCAAGMMWWLLAISPSAREFNEDARD